MSDLDPAHFYFLMFLLSYVVGATIIVALMVERHTFQVSLVLLFSAVGISLFNASLDVAPEASHLPDEAHAALTPNYEFLGFLGGNFIALAAIALAMLFLARWLVYRYAFQSAKLRQILVPHLWEQADQTPSSVEEQAKRWYVTIAGAAGSVTGVALADGKAWEVLVHALSPSQIFFTIFITVVSLVLIGPGEELVTGWGRAKSEEDESPSPLEELLQHLSARSVGRFLLVAAMWLGINVVHRCMDETLQAGQLTAATEMLFACVPMGIVTYYWCAALQRNVPSVARTAAISTATAMTFLLAPYAVIGMVTGLFTGVLAAAPFFPSFLRGLGGGYLFMFMTFALAILAIIAAFLFCALIYGGLAYLGGIVLDTDKRSPERASLLTIIRLVMLLLLWSALVSLLGFLLIDRFQFENWRWDGTTFLYLVGHLFWGAGLFVSGFPKIVEHARARTSGHPATPQGTAQLA